MRISTRIDYALRAMAEIAAAPADTPVRAQHIAETQHIPLKFLLAILNDLARAQLIRSQRGKYGGYLLRSDASAITLADIMRAVEGPLANVHDDSLREISYPGSAAALTDIWKAIRSSLRGVLEGTTLSQLASGRLPRRVQALAESYDRVERQRRRKSGR